VNINVKEHRRGNQTLDNPEKLAILGTQEQGRRKTKQKTHHSTQQTQIT